MAQVIDKILRKWMKLRLQPIRVYCLHHVCAELDEESMYACDWLNIDEFKDKVLAMRQNGVEFISLKEAYRHICEDGVRCKEYAVLTFDDGYTTLKEILPWLEEQKMPATLFINGKYLDGKSYRENPKEQYLTKDELWALTSPLIEIGNHGWEHKRVTEISEDEFHESVEKNVNLLEKHPNYVPFWAYAYDDHTQTTDDYFTERGVVPIYVDGAKNYGVHNVIHRELLA